MSFKEDSHFCINRHSPLDLIFCHMKRLHILIILCHKSKGFPHTLLITVPRSINRAELHLHTFLTLTIDSRELSATDRLLHWWGSTRGTSEQDADGPQRIAGRSGEEKVSCPC